MFWGLFGIIGTLIQIAIIVLIISWLVNRNKSKRKLTARTHSLTSATEAKGEGHMKETMLEQMNADLEQSVQTDKTVIIIGMALNLILIGVNTGVGAAAHEPRAGLAIKLIFFVLTAFVIILNVSVGYALSTGKKRRVKITQQLQKFWEDEGLAKYQDTSISSGYATRGNLFNIVTMALGAVTLIISSIAYFVGF